MQSHPKYSVIMNQTLPDAFVNSSNISVMNVSCPLSLNWVFKMSTSCSNTQSKSLSKWQDCLINELCGKHSSSILRHF